MSEQDSQFVFSQQESNALADAPWFAIFTRSRHEKVVAEQLRSKGFELILPLYASARKWKDRRVVVDLPLFPGYLFAQIQRERRLAVLQTPGVAGLVSNSQGPVPLNDADLALLHSGILASAEPHPLLVEGEKVKIRSGAFAGVEGILLRKKSRWRLVVSVNIIHRAVAVDVDAADVAPLGR